MSQSEVSDLVEGLFRREAGRLVSYLTRCFGSHNLSLAEDVVQETLAKALAQWPYRGVPRNPSAWLFRVARNHAIDILTVEQKRARKIEEIGRLTAADAAHEEAGREAMFRDDQLRMMFLCCHPSLTPESQVALTLKTLGGFSVAEIARGLRTKETAMAQRLVRAKHAIRESRLPFEMPSSEEVTARLDAVHHVLYQLFNKGYASPAGQDLVSDSLCADALYFAAMLTENHLTGSPATHALLALFCFQSSRLPARADSAGDLLLLDEQDRALWDRALIAKGFGHLEQARRADILTRYHLEAGIAACYAGAATQQATDWPALEELYTMLLNLTGSPIVALNRAVVLCRSQGPQAALRALDGIGRQKVLEEYYLVPATYGAVYRELGHLDRAAACFRAALDCPCSEPERRFLLRKLGETAAPREATRRTDFKG